MEWTEVERYIEEIGDERLRCYRQVTEQTDIDDDIEKKEKDEIEVREEISFNI